MIMYKTLRIKKKNADRKCICCLSLFLFCYKTGAWQQWEKLSASAESWNHWKMEGIFCLGNNQRFVAAGTFWRTRQTKQTEDRELATPPDIGQALQ